MLLSAFSIVIGYLLGSVSSASIIGRLFNYPEIKNEPDGRISASAVHHHAGLLPFALVVLMDISLAASSVFIAKALTQSTNIMAITGFMAVAGHNWSIFLKFKGGLGATAMAGVLLATLSWQALPGIFLAGVIHLITHRPGSSTLAGICIISATAFILNGPGILPILPLMLYVLMLLKKHQVARVTNLVN